MVEQKPVVWVSRGRGDTAVALSVRSEANTWKTAWLTELCHPHNRRRWLAPDVLCANVCMVLSERIARIMRQFNLRDDTLIAANSVRSDGAAPVEGRCYCLNLPAQRCFARANTMGKPHVYNAEHRYLPGWGNFKGDLVAVTPEALVGADLWTDVSLKWAYFVSDRLYKALKKQGPDKPRKFYCYRVDETHTSSSSYPESEPSEARHV